MRDESEKQKKFRKEMDMIVSCRLSKEETICSLMNLIDEMIGEIE